MKDVHISNVRSHVIIECNKDKDEDEDWRVYEISFDTLKLFFSEMLFISYFIVLILFS